MKRHVTATPILAEDCLRKGMSKSDRPHTDDHLNEFIDHFTMLNQHKHLSNFEMEGEDISQKTMLEPQNEITDQQEK